MALTFKFKADGSGYKRGLEDMRQKTKSWAGGIKGMLAGAFAMGAVIAAFKNLSSKFDRIHKLSKRFELDARSIQKLGFAAEQNGASMEIMAKAMAQGNRAAQEASNGLKTYQRAFDALNINVEEFKKLNQEEQMYRIADAIKNATDKNEAMAAAQQLLGRSALELMPLLKQGSEAMREQADSIKTLSDEQVAAFAKANDAINQMKTQVGGTIGVWISDMMNGFKVMVTGATQVAIEIGNRFTSISEIINHALKGNFKQAAASFKGMAHDAITSMSRIQKAMEDVGFDEFSAPTKKKGGSGSGGGGEDTPLTKAAKSRLEIEKQIAAEIEKQADATRSLEEKVNKAKGAWLKLMEEQSALEESDAGDNSTDAEKLEISKKQLEQEKAYTRLKELERQQAKQIADQEEKAAKTEADYIAKRNEEQKRYDEEEAAKKKEEEEKAAQILDTQENHVSSSSLQSVGLGGEVSAFVSDPALSEAKRQSMILEKIETHLQPAGGVESTPAL